MDVALDIAMIVGGIALLAWSGDALVDFSAAIAEKARLSPAVIGLTVVAAGTSMPEGAVSAFATYGGYPSIAVGNVVGSNIFNIGLVLGTCALVAPIPVSKNTFRLDFPFVVLATVAMIVFARDGSIDRWEATFFLVALVSFWIYSVTLARRQTTALEAKQVERLIPEEAEKLKQRPTIFLLGMLLLTFAGLTVGARILVAGAADLALAIGFTERVVGLTVVAAGTSAPELVASLAAARKREHEMAVANIMGSNLFNLLLILGVSAQIRPLAVEDKIIHFDNWVMLGFTLLLAPMLYRGFKLSRVEGAILLACHVSYVGYLIIAR